MNGFINVDKPLGITSHDVVAQLRRVLKRAGNSAKVGHAGTLDPLATGVLIVCLGDATRLSDYVMAERKVYEAHIQFGVATTTYDAEGAITATHDASGLLAEQVEAAFTPFVGVIQQVPPVYSAIKQGGKKLYELARQGIDVELTPRTVHIVSLALTHWDAENQRASVQVVCGAGTYIRSLAHDMGQNLGVGAHLVGLRRLASGAFEISHSQQLNDLNSLENLQRALISPALALSDWTQIALTAQESAELRQGRAIARPLSADSQGDTALSESGLALGLDASGGLVALLRAEGALWQPHKVFGVS